MKNCSKIIRPSELGVLCALAESIPFYKNFRFTMSNHNVPSFKRHYTRFQTARERCRG